MVSGRSALFAVIGLAVGSAAVPVSLARAAVNLELRTSPSVFRVGDVVSVGLYAVSDSAADQPFSALDVVLTWAPVNLELLGRVNNGPFVWPSLPGFPNDGGLDRLNADCGPDLYCDPFTKIPFNDGDALFQAFVLFGATPPTATPAGLLVTTLQFRALAAAGATTIEIAEPGDECQGTCVLFGDGERVLRLTGRVSPVTVVVAACGSGGDFDGDCDIRLADYAVFAPCLLGPDVATPCPAADLDGDGDGDLRDFSFVQSSLGGP